MQNQGRKMFAVTLLKRDQQHIIISQTENYDEARATWTKLVEAWTRALKDQHPLVLDNSVTATAFDPGLVYEITIKTMDLTSRVNTSNPYTQDMLANGFSNSFGAARGSNMAHDPGQGVLDGGFKF